MGYDREIYEKVKNQLFERKIKAEDDLEKRKSIFYLRFPRAKEIEKSLSSISSGIAKAVLRGKNVKEALEELKEKSNELKEELSQILKNAQLGESYLIPQYYCKFCRDEGFIDGKMCRCMKELLKKESYKKLVNVSPIFGKNFRNFSLDYYLDVGKPSPKEKMNKILNYCAEYATNFGKDSKSLIFIGGTGLGKTHLSMAIASEVINKGYSVIYTSAHNMISRIEKERFREDSEGRTYYLNCDLLIIDDLGTEFSSNFSNSVLYDIIDSRLVFKRPVIISTNLSAEEFEGKYGSQISSRVFGCYELLKFLGQDVRLKLRKQRKNMEKQDIGC